MKLFNVGSLNLDYVYEMPHFVREGETLTAGERQCKIGGKGLNQSVAASRAGAQTFHVGCIGADGTELSDYLRNAGVDVGFVARVDTPTGHAVIQVQPDGKNCIIIYGGANRQITDAQLETALSAAEPGDWLLTQNETNAAAQAIRLAHEKGLTVVFNPSPITPELAQMPLECVDWFLVNETEGFALSGAREIGDILPALLKKYPRAHIVLTLGEDGCRYADANGQFSLPALRVKAVDTTGAGDTFTGFFLAAMMRGEPTETALRQATAASALAVTRPGAAQSIPTLPEVSEFLK